jgi:L-threonylcarbamoyladenylate synthase
VPGWLAGRDEVAVRIPDDDFLVDVVKLTGPLLATSANFHSEDPRESVDKIVSGLKGEPDLIIDGGPRATVPSTLVNCRLVPPVIERVGAVSREEIEKVLT